MAAPVAQSVSALYLYDRCGGCEFEPHLEHNFINNGYISMCIRGVVDVTNGSTKFHKSYIIKFRVRLKCLDMFHVIYSPNFFLNAAFVICS